MTKLTFKELLSNRYKYITGSSTVGSVAYPTKEWVLERLQDIIKHNGIVWDFLLWLDGADEVVYIKTFDKLLTRMLSSSQIDATLKKFFSADLAKCVYWKLNRAETAKFAEKIIAAAKLNSQYQQYLKDMA